MLSKRITCIFRILFDSFSLPAYDTTFSKKSTSIYLLYFSILHNNRIQFLFYTPSYTAVNLSFQYALFIRDHKKLKHQSTYLPVINFPDYSIITYDWLLFNTYCYKFPDHLASFTIPCDIFS